MNHISNNGYTGISTYIYDQESNDCQWDVEDTDTESCFVHFLRKGDEKNIQNISMLTKQYYH